MASHLIKPFKFFLKPSLGNLLTKSRMSTELSKLPGNYKMSHHTEYYKASNVPAELVAVMLNRKDLEMFISLEEKNGQWSYKTEHFIKGLPVGGNEITFKVGENIKMEGNDPTDPKNFGRVMEMSVESMEGSLILKGEDETMTLTPSLKHCGERMIMITREVKGENNPTHKMYFEKSEGLEKFCTDAVEEACGAAKEVLGKFGYETNL